MECDKIQEQLSEYLEDALSPAEKGIIDNHLKSCLECRASLADLEMTVHSLKNLEEIIPPPWLTQKVMTRIKAEAERKKGGFLKKLFYPLYIKLPLEAVGIFLIAVTALYVFKSMEPEIKTRMAPSEETVSEYTAKAKDKTMKRAVKKPSQSPTIMQSKKDKTTDSVPSLKENRPLPAPPSEQFMYDKGPSLKEKRAEVLEAPEREMMQKSMPAEAGLSADDGLKQESAVLAPEKKISRVSGKEDISLSFKADNLDHAKANIKEILSNLGGRVMKEESSLDAILIVGELGHDKLLPFMQKLKMLGYVKEKTPTPISDKDRVLIKITVVKP